MIKKLFFTAAIMFAFFSSWAGNEKTTQSIAIATLQANYSPAHPYIASEPLINANSNSASSSWNFTQKSLYLRMFLKVDPFITQVVHNNVYYKAKIKYHYLIYIFNPQTGNFEGNLTAVAQELEVDFDPETNHIVSSDIALIKTPNAWKIELSVDEVWIDDVLITSLTDIPSNLSLETEFESERYYKEDLSLDGIVSTASIPIDLDFDNKADELQIYWGFYPGAEEYDLEWTFINDYATSDLNTAISPAYLNYSFKENSTRVRVSENHYQIPLLFDRGYIVYRVRPICRKAPDFLLNVYKNWSIQNDFGSISSLTSGYYRVQEPYFKKGNWQAIATYAEEGKNKVAVNYMDGTLRSRQSAIKINTLNLPIIEENIYDFFGRPAIKVLPAPSDTLALRYYRGFNRDLLEKPYSYKNFDFNDPNDSCSTLLSSMNTSSGASKYYSPYNRDTTGYNTYIPDAIGYPFYQVEYEPDNTGRIRRSGSFGEAFQLTFGGKYTSYLYGQPVPEEIYTIFGTEVGYANHYKKNIIIDPNNQANISYTNLSGKTIATALAGAEPSNLDRLENNDSAMITTNLLYSDAINPDKNTLKVESNFSIEKENTPYVINYDVTGASYTDSCLSDVCYQCVYDLYIKLVDNKCGIVLFEDTARIGNFNTSCGSSPVKNFTHPLVLNKGSYSLIKTLKVDENVIEKYASFYVDSLQSGCLDTFKLSPVDTTICFFSCDSCVSQLGTVDQFITKYTPLLQNLDTAQLSDIYYQFLDECKAMCDNESPCKISYGQMQEDIFPGNQYAEFQVDDTSAVNTSLFPLSVLNETNSFLPVGQNWRFPIPFYKDGYGDTAFVLITGTNYQVLNPTLTFFRNGSYYILPQNLKKVEDFIYLYKSNPSWADALITYHPEYPYYKWCQKTDEEISGFNGTYKTSNQFDDYLRNIDSLNASFIANFLNNDTTIIDNDPFFAVGGAGQDTICQGFTYFMNTPVINLTGRKLMIDYLKHYYASYSMAEFAYITKYCPQQYYNNGNQLNCNIPPAMSSLITSENITDFLSFYLDAKKRVQDVLSDCYVKENYPLNVINDCMGGYEGHSWAGLFNFWTYPEKSYSGVDNSQFQDIFSRLIAFNSLMPSYYDGSWIRYKNKIVRFPKSIHAKSMMNLTGESADIADELKKKNEFNMYASTGQCPLALHLQNILGSLLDGKQLFSNIPDLNIIPGFSQELYTALGGSPSAQTSINYAFDTTSNYSTFLANISTPPPGSSNSVISFTMPSGFSFNNIKDMGQLEYSFISGNNYMFTLKIKYPLTASHDTIFTVNGYTSLIIGQCSFEDECPSTPEAKDLQNIVNFMQAYYLQNNGSVINQVVPAPFDALIDSSSLTHYLGTNASTLLWSIDPNNNTFILTKGLNRIEMVFNINNPAIQSGVPFYNIKRSNNGTDGSFDIYQKLSNTTAILTFSGYVKYTSNSDQDTFYVSQCHNPIPSECDNPEFKNTYNLGYFLKELMVRHKLDQNYTISPGGVLPNHLRTQLAGAPSTLYWKPSVSANGDTLTGRITTATDTLCTITLNNVLDPLVFGDLDSLRVPEAVYSAGQVGSTYKFSVKVYNNEVAYMLEGKSCFPLQNCTNCLEMKDTLYNCTFDNATTFTTAFALEQVQFPEDQKYIITQGSNSFINFTNYPELPGGNHFYEIDNPGIGNYLMACVKGFPLNTGKKLFAFDGSVKVKAGKKYRVEFDQATSKLHPGEEYYLAIKFNGNVYKTIHINDISDPWVWNRIECLWDSNQDTTVNMEIVFYYQNYPTPFHASRFNPVFSIDNIRFGEVGPCSTINFDFPMDSVTTPINPCPGEMADLSANNDYIIYKSYADSARNSIKWKIQQHCLTAAQHFIASYRGNYYQYTLYYYDQSGNLVKTVPPQGVLTIKDTAILNRIDSTLRFGKHYTTTNTNHTLPSLYYHNSLNQITTQYTPDAGWTKFWYDRLGRIIASQNAQQQLENKYSYTLYDKLNRIEEVGEKISSTSPGSNNFIEMSVFLSWLGNSKRYQITHTWYDNMQFNLSAYCNGFSQENLRTRVSAVAVFDSIDLLPNYYTHASLFSYDIHGNVKTLYNDNRIIALLQANQRCKKIDYQYDLVSGNVNQVSYQPGAADQFYHRYLYDADNRLTHTFTSCDGELWDKDAKYFYYKHGPLARTEIGDLAVQGIDYAYTLQGWVKGINSNALDAGIDIGRDNCGSGIHQMFASDLASYSLAYYGNDYKPIGNYLLSAANYRNFVAKTNNITTLATDAPDLYNGNISHMVTTIMDANNAVVSPQLTAYRYDQLNRIKQMFAYQSLTANSWNNAQTNAYAETYRYDANGNIDSLSRWDATQVFDQLKYNYNVAVANTNPTLRQLSNNRLTGVTQQNAAPITDKFKTSYYDYDAIGNLIRDTSEKITNIEWNVYRKITKIIKNGDLIEYIYDAMGNRICKKLTPQKGVSVYYFYTRDAQGNIIATYKFDENYHNDGLYLTEHDVFGSSRIGIVNYNLKLNTATVSKSLFKRNLGLKRYEIANHLGNVITTFTDQKKYLASGTDITGYSARLISTQDYYPFGMQMSGRSFNEAGSTRGFNGQEKDREVYSNGNTYTATFWEYDGRIGRRWNVDPKPTIGISDYACFGNNPIFFNDPFGDKIDPKNIKKDDNETYQKTKSDWEAQTGYTLTENDKTGYLEIDKSKGIKKDENGKKIGSVAARGLLKKAIDVDDVFKINKSVDGGNSSDRNTGEIFLDGNQTKEGMNNAVGINVNDAGYGIVGFHELSHVVFNVGDVEDYHLDPSTHPGKNESRYVNTIRKQLGYDERTCYRITVNNYDYITYDVKTRSALINGYIPKKEGKYTFYKSKENSRNK